MGPPPSWKEKTLGAYHRKLGGFCYFKRKVELTDLERVGGLLVANEQAASKQKDGWAHLEVHTGRITPIGREDRALNCITEDREVV